MSRYWILELDERTEPTADGAAAVAAAVRALVGGIDLTATGARLELPAAVSLSTRERHVMRQVARGMATKQIARELCRSERTVKTHLNAVMNKLGAENRTHAAVLATRMGLL
jgi:DNA-binding NarL/FixJ family response regulator